jgi:hypothetical protein
MKVPVKSAPANVSSIPVNQKYQILRYNTLVANERYVSAMSLASPGVNTF